MGEQTGEPLMQELKDALQSLGANVQRFEDLELQSLWNHGYTDYGWLLSARRDGLTRTGLSDAKVDYLLWLQGGAALTGFASYDNVAANGCTTMSPSPLDYHVIACACPCNTLPADVLNSRSAWRWRQWRWRWRQWRWRWRWRWQTRWHWR